MDSKLFNEAQKAYDNIGPSMEFDEKILKKIREADENLNKQTKEAQNSEKDKTINIKPIKRKQYFKYVALAACLSLLLIGGSSLETMLNQNKDELAIETSQPNMARMIDEKMDGDAPVEASLATGVMEDKEVVFTAQGYIEVNVLWGNIKTIDGQTMEDGQMINAYESFVWSFDDEVQEEPFIELRTHEKTEKISLTLENGQYILVHEITKEE